MNPEVSPADPEIFVVAPEVREALEEGGPVVALETSVIGQGLPSPENIECAGRMEAAVRRSGAVPAWIGLVDGSVRVGLGAEELARFATPGAAVKVAARDIPEALAGRALGATTVSATIRIGTAAGITVSTTGGIGGVHPGPNPDVSADLVELALTPGLLVCSGPKSIVDPVATAEGLEELGVALVGYGVERLPFFLVREVAVDLEHRADTPEEAAEILHAALALGVRSTTLLCNPIPPWAAMDPEEVAAAVVQAEARAVGEGVHGKGRTPFLLRALADLTGGASLRANLALLEDNAALAARVSVALTRRTRRRT
jgi:pseudouridine-5'-phosphate glycosidase